MLELKIYSDEFGKLMNRFYTEGNRSEYLKDLLSLRGKVGISIEDDDAEIRFLHRRLSQEISFITGSKCAIQSTEPTINNIGETI